MVVIGVVECLLEEGEGDDVVLDDADGGIGYVVDGKVVFEGGLGGLVVEE